MPMGGRSRRGCAWESISPFVMTLAHGGDFCDGWMKAMISCNVGFRPVSFCMEALDEDETQKGLSQQIKELSLRTGDCSHWCGDRRECLWCNPPRI